MAQLAPGELRRFNLEPIESVDYVLDLDYVGDGIRQHRLDVIAPRETSGPLPVYVYFHGGGWTSGDKSALTKYCASQATGGMVVVNVNYRMATRFQMRHMLQDAEAALSWVARNIARYGGDPKSIVLGGDSAGGQIAALLAASTSDDDLAQHFGLNPGPDGHIVGVVQHCSAVDFSVMLERGFILSLEFVRMLLPQRGRGLLLAEAARYLSPIEWVGPKFPPVFITTSEQDPFYRANLNFISRLRARSVPVDVLIYDRASRNTRHTWQQDYRYPESQEVYRRLQKFVNRVAPQPQLAG
jgi:acetyl esterase